MAETVEAQGVFSGERIGIIADQRESRTKTYEWLKSFDATIIEKQLDVGDYIVSDRVGIERKTITDFLQSILNQRLFRQLEGLCKSFDKPLMILEGDQRTLFSARNIHPNTIHGVLSSISIDYRIPIIWMYSPKMTASQIYWTAWREQKKEKRGLQTRACKKTKDTGKLQEFMVAGLPNVNNVLSKRLLNEFKTVNGVFSASEEELKKVAGIGKKKAKSIRCLLNSEYKEG
jgi:Fanconi anemia group M protein